MQISAIPQSSPWSSLATPDRQAHSSAANGAPPAAIGDAATPPAPDAGDIVSLRGGDAAPAAAGNGFSGQPAEVFAEIWKGGLKLGVVYTDGQAVLPNTPDGTGGSGNGAMFAYLRAQQISQQVGGEVRLVNLPALQVAQTRAQLQAAYGVRG